MGNAAKLSDEEVKEELKKKKRRLQTSALSDDEVKAMLKQKRDEKLLAKQSDEDFEKDPGFLGETDRFAKAAANSALFGFGPEIAAGAAELGELVGLADDVPYEERVDEYAEQLRKEREASPYVTGAGDIAGMLIPGAAATKVVGKGLKAAKGAYAARNARQLGKSAEVIDRARAMAKPGSIAKILGTSAAAGVESAAQTPLPNKGQLRSEQDLFDPEGRLTQGLIGAGIGGGLSTIAAGKRLLFGKNVSGPTGGAAKNVKKSELNKLGYTGGTLTDQMKKAGKGIHKNKTPRQVVDETLDFARGEGYLDLDGADDILEKIFLDKQSVGKSLGKFYEVAGDMERKGLVSRQKISRFKPLINLSKELKKQGVGNKKRRKLVRKVADSLSPLNPDSTIDEIWNVRRALDKESRWDLKKSTAVVDAYKFLRREIDDQLQDIISSKEYRKAVPDVDSWIGETNKYYSNLSNLNDIVEKGAGKEMSFKSIDLDSFKRSVTDPMVIETGRMLSAPDVKRAANIMSLKVPSQGIDLSGGVAPSLAAKISSKLTEGNVKSKNPDMFEVPEEDIDELINEISTRRDIDRFDRAKLKSQINSSVRSKQPVRVDRKILEKYYPKQVQPKRPRFGLENLRGILGRPTGLPESVSMERE